MKYIQRKTNVRNHNRQTKHKTANIRNHERNLRGRTVLGTIPLKDLRYKQAKRRFPTLEPYGDADDDGVVNKRDCRPFDTERQDDDEEKQKERDFWREQAEKWGADEEEREAEREAEARAEDAMFNTDNRRRSPDIW